MKILLFTTTYLDLYKPVVESLERQCHEVSVILDPMLPNDPKFKAQKVSSADQMHWESSVKDFWLNHSVYESGDYDIFLSLNGISITPEIVSGIKKSNPHIRTVIYAWDGLRYVDFNNLRAEFHECFSFDVDDCTEFSKWQLLPVFHVNEKIGNTYPPKYDLFCIGTNHDNRLEFLSNIKTSIHDQGFKYILKVVPEKRKAWDYVKMLLISPLRQTVRKTLLFELGLANRSLKINSPLSINEYNRYLTESKCIIDDVRHGQGGLSPRFVWAIASGKKVLTTNERAYRYSFVNQSNTRIIDKQYPLLPLDFISSNDSVRSDMNTLQSLFIDNWVNILLGLIPLPKFSK